MSDQAAKSVGELFRIPNVRNLVFAYLVTYLGTAMAPIAMAFGVLELTDSTKSMSLVMASGTVAIITVLMISGVVADRTSRQKVIVWSESVAMVAQAIIAVLFITETATVPLLAVFMFINGMAFGFNGPAETGFIPQLVDKKDLQKLNSILGIARHGAMVAGAALGGLLVSVIGAGWTFAIDAATFAMSAFLISRMTTKTQTFAESEPFFRQLALGWKVFMSHTWLWTIVLQFAFVLAGYQAVLNVLGPAVSQEIFDGSKSWGWVMAALSTGLFVGGFIGIKYTPRYPLRVASFCVFSAALIPLALGGPFSLGIVIIAAFLNGVGWELFGILWVSTLQKKIPSEYLSRVSAYDYIGSIGLAPVGMIVVGFAYEALGFQTVALVCGALIIVATVLVLLVKDVWTLTFAKSVK